MTKVYIAAGILSACIAATMLGFNSWIQSVGFMSAGFLFGSTAKKEVKKEVKKR